MTNYTSYFLTSSVKVGPEKSSLLITPDKKKIL